MNPLEPQSGEEAAFLRVFRQLSPRQQEAALAAALRRLDGQPFQESMIEMLIEWGDPPEVARATVKEVSAQRHHHVDWRTFLD
jgi:hypothetical protein